MKRTSTPIAALVAAVALTAFAAPALAERGEHAGAMFELFDTNADGAIDAGEFAAAGQQRFERRDANGDGYLDKAEFTAPRERPAGAPEPSAEQLEKRAKMHERFFVMLDRDDDGKVSQAEAATAGERMFARLDANEDGRLEREEMRRHRHGKPEAQ